MSHKTKEVYATLIDELWHWRCPYCFYHETSDKKPNGNLKCSNCKEIYRVIPHE